MALYTGNYKDIFQKPAKYTLVKTESESVGQTASYTYKSGKDLLVHAGTLHINATTLIEGQTIQYEIDPVRINAAWSCTISFIGVNANLYGGFMLNCGLAVSVGRVVVSHGITKWTNSNYIKLLISTVIRKRTNSTDKVFAKTRIFTAVHYVRGKSLTRSARSSNTS